MMRNHLAGHGIGDCIDMILQKRHNKVEVISGVDPGKGTFLEMGVDSQESSNNFFKFAL